MNRPRQDQLLLVSLLASALVVVVVLLASAVAVAEPARARAALLALHHPAQVGPSPHGPHGQAAAWSAGAVEAEWLTGVA